MAIYLLQAGGDPSKLDEVEAKLRPAIPDLKRIGGVAEIDQRLVRAADQSFVLLLAPSTDREAYARLTEIIGRYRGSAYFILISEEISGSDLKQLLQTGAADWAQESRLPQEVLETIARVRPQKAAAEAAAQDRAFIVSFVPSAGGTGNATLAIETAIQLVKRKDVKAGGVCLIDLDVQSSHICDYLDIAPQLKVEEFVDAPERIDAQLLQSFSVRHASGVDVLAAPRNRFHSRDLTLDALSALFDLIARRYAYVIVDLPLTQFPWTLPMLSESQAIFVTGLNTIPGLRQTSETYEAIRSDATITGTVRVVINRCEIGILGGVARGDHVASTLGEEKPLFVRESANLLGAINIGAPLSVSRASDKMVKDIAAIADLCAAAKAAAAHK